jgi:hypothetical protein
MKVIEVGIVMDENDEHRENREFKMEVIEAAIMMDCNGEH